LVVSPRITPENLHGSITIPKCKAIGISRIIPWLKRFHDVAVDLGRWPHRVLIPIIANPDGGGKLKLPLVPIQR
jgi:hypothetical protein